MHPRVGDQVPHKRGKGVVVERRQRRTRTHILARVAVEPRDPPHGAPTVPYVTRRRVFGSVVAARKRGEGDKERRREGEERGKRHLNVSIHGSCTIYSTRHTQAGAGLSPSFVHLHFAHELRSAPRRRRAAPTVDTVQHTAGTVMVRDTVRHGDQVTEGCVCICACVCARVWLYERASGDVCMALVYGGEHLKI